MDARLAMGRRGEELAARLLERQGFRIVERNYRCRLGEIDLIARRGDLIVFCEVKTRQTDAYGAPCEAVDHRKRARLRRLAAWWLSERKPGRVDVRFDVVSIIVRGRHAVPQHLEDAF